MTQSIRVLALGGDVLRNAILDTASGGDHLDQGLAAALTAGAGDYELSVAYSPIDGIGELRARLAIDSIEAAFGIDPHVVVIEMSAEVESLNLRSDDPHEAVRSFHDDLVAVFDAIKSGCDAHVLVAGVSTYDPGDPISNLHGLESEPIMLRAHRVNLALFQISHEVGLSVIDVDRMTAESGGGKVVPAPLALSREGSALVRDETLRVLTDYGFFDGRSVVAQVGNRGGNT